VRNLFPGDAVVPRLSEATKRARGTLRPGRSRPRASPRDRLLTVPEPPPEISAGGRAEWIRLAPLLLAVGTASRADLRAFELLAEALGSERAMRELIERDGTMIAAAGGGYKAHPAIRAAETARAQAIALLRDFGLTPSGRARVDVIPLRTAADFDFDR
jgi:P27 family predicted phage terminase small subunit